MVLTEVIIEGRRTFANTMKYLYISTGETMPEDSCLFFINVQTVVF